MLAFPCPAPLLDCHLWYAGEALAFPFSKLKPLDCSLVNAVFFFDRQIALCRSDRSAVVGFFSSCLDCPACLVVANNAFLQASMSTVAVAQQDHPFRLVSDALLIGTVLALSLIRLYALRSAPDGQIQFGAFLPL